MQKRLLFGNVFIDEVRAATLANNRPKQQLIPRVVTGKVVKKYRLASNVKWELGFNKTPTKGRYMKLMEVSIRQRFPTTNQRIPVN